MQRAASLLGLLALAGLGTGVSVYASQYLTNTPDAFPFLPQRQTYADQRLALMVHVASGAGALLLGPLQFIPRIRRALPVAHRIAGYFYVLCVLFSSLAGIWIAASSFGAPVSSAGFMVLGIIWPACTLTAIWFARIGDFVLHRVWMMRSYSLTFAAVTLRAELGILIYAGGFSLEDAYQTVSWSSWALNLIFVEWVLLRRRK